MRLKHIFPVMSLVAVAICLQPRSHSQAAPPQTQNGKQRPVVHDAQQQSEGEKVFEQNCSRCHTAPDGFSSRISGTIVKHMRVRASLSQHQEEELLRFLNP
jgi:cytochrome c5